MIDFKTVIQAWITAINPTEEQRDLAEYRMEVCEPCEKRKQWKKTKLFYCEECGCPISKKIFSPIGNFCPLQKWKM